MSLSDQLTSALATMDTTLAQYLQLVEDAQKFYAQPLNVLTLTGSGAGPYTGTIPSDKRPVTPGSTVLTFISGSLLIHVTDNSSGAFINGTYITSATINYTSGAVSVTFVAAPDAGQAVNLLYEALVTLHLPDGSGILVDSLGKMKKDIADGIAAFIDQALPVANEIEASLRNPFLVKTFYVNAGTGNDAHAGTSGAPFQTLMRALKEARPNFLTLINLAHANTYPMTGQIYVHPAAQIQIGGDLLNTTGRDNTIIDFSAYRSTQDDACFNVVGNLNFGYCTIKCGQRVDDLTSPSFIDNLPATLVHPGALVECTGVKILPSDSVNNYDGPPSSMSQCAVEVRGGSFTLSSLCVLNMLSGSTKLNGVVLRQGGNVVLFTCTIQNCAYGVSDQACSRSGGFVNGSGITWTTNTVNFDFGSLSTQIARHNLV